MPKSWRVTPRISKSYFVFWWHSPNEISWILVHEVSGPIIGQCTSFLRITNLVGPSRRRQSLWPHGNFKVASPLAFFFLCVFLLTERLFAARVVILVLWKSNLLTREKSFFFPLFWRCLALWQKELLSYLAQFCTLWNSVCMHSHFRNL